MTWTVMLVSQHDRVAAELVREYLGDIIGRYYGRPATSAEVAQALVEDPAELAAFLLAYCDGALAGCAGLGVLGPGVAELKRMYVRPAFRGRGGGAVLLAAIDEQARSVGARVIRLDTRSDLVEARALYARHGYAEIDAYNDSPYAQHWFEKRLRA